MKPVSITLIPFQKISNLSGTLYELISTEKVPKETPVSIIIVDIDLPFNKPIELEFINSPQEAL
jgi:hypothetical protein